MDFSETIVAPITGTSKAAVAIVRLSGTDAHSIACAICPRAGSDLRHAYYSSICVGDSVIDDGLCTLFGAGATYTGEDVAEISCHGSLAIVHAIVEEAIRLGARFARPGEFTERAFLNGCLDLSQAEAVREIVESGTAVQARRAEALRAGRLFEKVAELEMLIGGAIAAIEAVVDFSDEVGDLDREAVRASLEAATEKIDALLAGVPVSRLIRNGLRIALIGRPNVGKSSLLNALIELDRAIVTDIPGTTRDTLEEGASIAGYPVVLTDTAGIRDTEDTIEALGVERSRQAISQADSVWLVFEANIGITAEDLALKDSVSREVLWVGNKADLGDAGGDGLRVSALSKEGVEPLKEWIVSKFDAGHLDAIANDRHEPELVAALAAISRAYETLANETLPVDLACVDLYDALDRLGRITGRSAPDEVIQRVFADFCIGK